MPARKILDKDGIKKLFINENNYALHLLDFRMKDREKTCIIMNICRKLWQASSLVSHWQKIMVKRKEEMDGVSVLPDSEMMELVTDDNRDENVKISVEGDVSEAKLGDSYLGACFGTSLLYQCKFGRT